MDRFKKSDENNIKNLKEASKNSNTEYSTENWIRVFIAWASSRGYNTAMESYSPVDLNKKLEQFYAEIRKKDGEEYEPDSLKVMHASLDRYLKEKKYPESILNGKAFSSSKAVLEGYARNLRKCGKGKKPNRAKALTPEEEDILWRDGHLGDTNGRSLQCTIWWILTQHFSLRGWELHYREALMRVAYLLNCAHIKFPLTLGFFKRF